MDIVYCHLCRGHTDTHTHTHVYDYINLEHLNKTGGMYQYNYTSYDITLEFCKMLTISEK